MTGAWPLILLIGGLVFGFVGVLIAANKGVSQAAGFWLGAFLGPIGLVIVALLSPSDPSLQPVIVPQTFTGERDLSSDAYKLWLTSRYDLKKNEVLGQFVVGDRLFPTIEDALGFAGQQHAAEIAAAEAERQRKMEERARWQEQERKRLAEAEENFRRWKPWLIGAFVFVSIVMGYLTYHGVEAGMRRDRIEKAKLAAEKAKEDGLRSTANEALSSFGLSLAETARGASVDSDAGHCDYSAGGEAKRIIPGKAMHFLTGTYPPAKSPDDVIFMKKGDWEDLSSTLNTLMVEAQRLYRNKATGEEALITVEDKTDYKSSSADLNFNVRVDLCVGKVPEPKIVPPPSDPVVSEIGVEGSNDGDTETEYYDE